VREVVKWCVYVFVLVEFLFFFIPGVQVVDDKMLSVEQGIKMVKNMKI